jgi:hypothetical protein
MASTNRWLRALEILGLTLVLGALPIALAVLLLPTNEYAWMADEGDAVPPDCDIFTGELLIPTSMIFVGALAGFGLAARRRRTWWRLTAACISATMLLGNALKLPEYLSERARAAEHCSQ